MSNTPEVTDSQFEANVLKSDQPVLVDFWAAWCGPCRAIAPVVEELSSELEGKARVFKMNIDDNPNTPGQLGIRSIPTLKVFVGGKEVNEMVGAGSKEQLLALIQPHLN